MNQRHHLINISGPCEKLPEYFDPSLSVTETFPVATGTVLDVTLSCTDNELAVGDKTITCYGGSHFYYSKTPECIPQGKTNGLDMPRALHINDYFRNIRSIILHERTSHHSTSGDCTKLHPAWFYMTTETTFPVAPGDLITVKCPDGFINQGSETITCQNEIHYKFDMQPRCEATGMIFKTSFDVKTNHT